MNSINKTLLTAGLLASSLAFAYFNDASSFLHGATDTRTTHFESQPLAAESPTTLVEPLQAEEIVLTPEPGNEHSDSKIQLALLLDTSGSMGGLIEQAKSQIWTIVNELSGAEKDGVSPVFEIALYQYGNSGISARDHYVQQIFPFTSNIDGVNQALFDLTINGGEEYCGAAIKNSITSLDWSINPDDLKIIYIAGNEPFTQGPIAYDKQCQAANDQSIVINTIFCGNSQEGINSNWQNGAHLTGGEYFTINHDHAVAQIASPFDQQLSQLNMQLNECMVYHGDAGRAGYFMNAQQDSLSLKQGLSSYNSRNKFKSSASYGSQWDITTMPDEELLEFIADNDLQDFSDNVKSDSASSTYQNIQELKSQKEKIKLEITEYVKQREQYIADQRKLESEDKKDNSLGASIVRSIRSQGKQRAFDFED